MKVRSVTLGNNLTWPLSAGEFDKAGRFLSRARQLFSDRGIEVQTLRLATQPVRGMPASLPLVASAVERACRESGIGYFALGPAPLDPAAIYEAIAATSVGFISVIVASGGDIDGPAVQAAAGAMKRLAQVDGGLGNVRFGATAHCGPNIPFFPVAYHDGGHPKFSLALQAADVAAANYERLEDALVALDQQVTPVAKRLEKEFAIEYLGADFSPAPDVTPEESVVRVFEAGGVERVGAPGSLAVAARITRALKTAPLNRWGFNGLMLPVLEDASLAAASAWLSVRELLLFSGVCGTGLDCVPLPGDIGEADLAGLILDVATFSTSISGKPLTARLLPIPGKAAGERTEFAAEGVANAMVLSC